MGKAYSRAAKRRAKKALPELAKIPNRAKSRGRARMGEIQEDAQKAVLSARAHKVGCKDISAMRSAMLEDGAGQALYLSLEGSEAKQLWGHYTALTAAQRRYHLSLGVSIHAKTAKVEFQPEVFEARDDEETDLRTEEERDEAAAKAWGIWSSRISELGNDHAASIYTAIQGYAELVRDGTVLPAGIRFVRAMQTLDKVVE